MIKCLDNPHLESIGAALRDLARGTSPAIRQRSGAFSLVEGETHSTVVRWPGWVLAPGALSLKTGGFNCHGGRIFLRCCVGLYLHSSDQNMVWVVGCGLWAVIPVSQPAKQSAALDWQHCLRRAGEMRHNAWLACSCLIQQSSVPLTRVRGHCVGELRPLVASCGLLCGMDTSSEGADQGPTTY
jgi:hypothetical protein